MRRYIYTWFWKGLKKDQKRFSIPSCTITGSSPSFFRCHENSGKSPMPSNGTKFVQLESDPPAIIWMLEKATYTTPSPCSVKKLHGAVALATLHSLHDSDNSGVDARNVAKTSLVSNLIIACHIHCYKNKTKISNNIYIIKISKVLRYIMLIFLFDLKSGGELVKSVNEVMRKSDYLLWSFVGKHGRVFFYLLESWGEGEWALNQLTICMNENAIAYTRKLFKNTLFVR